MHPLPLGVQSAANRRIDTGFPAAPTTALASLPAGTLQDAVLVPSAKSTAVYWARHLDEVREAQRLRYEVFAHELCADLSTPLPLHDVDVFDDYCEHLIVRDSTTQQVVGTYRVLMPSQAKRLGGTYTDTEFDLVRLRSMRERMVEFGRSCVHPQYRQGPVIMGLWGALLHFMASNQMDSMIGCASVPMLHNGVIAGDVAASIWRRLQAKHLAPIDLRVVPRNPLPLHRFDAHLEVEPPALIKGYLRLGAKLLGPPAWDQAFNTADLPMMLRLQDLQPKYRRHFLGV